MDGIGSAHVVANDDAAFGVQADGLGEIDGGADADGHADDVGRQHRAVVEFDTGDSHVAGDRLRVRASEDPDTSIGEGLLQQVPRGGVELALHERGREGGRRRHRGRASSGRPQLRGRAARRR